MIEPRRGLGASQSRGVRQAKAVAAVSPARAAAAEVLLRVGSGHGHSDDLLHGPILAGLSQEDRNLATALVMGVLRWQIALDSAIQPLFARPDVLPVAQVMIALRLGAFQIQHLERIPAHAAINESVELVRASGNPQATGMVNAILRRLMTAKLPPKRLHESVAMFAKRLGHPAWLAERWASTYGREAAERICLFDQREPACGTLFASEKQRLMPVMDDGSRLVAEIAAVVAPDAKRIWDCCAAPGGKALVLARRHPRAELLATDASPRRLRSLTERLKREAADSTIQTAVADATELPAEFGNFDLILCDVPCSGTGTLARNPEIRHRINPAEFERQAERQGRLLQAALERLASGGRLMYSTCSLEPEENERLIEAALSRTGGLRLIDAEPFLDELKAQGVLRPDADLGSSFRNGYLRTLPGSGLEADGFFAAVLTR